MSARRFPTKIGIAVGGAVGALVALYAGPTEPTPPRAAPEPLAVAQPSAGPSAQAPASAASAAGSVSAATPASAPSLLSVPSAAPPTLAPLVLPQTPGQLRKAELWCDQRRDIDECLRAARAHELGSAGPIDSVQARRFQNITMTYLVQQCEGGSPHACFLLADRYETGTGLKASRVSAAALRKRALELCRVRSAPECPRVHSDPGRPG